MSISLSYRELEDRFGNTSYELASAEWKKSDPDGVNDWFKSWLNRKKKNGQKHSREVIRLVKSMCKNRPSYSLPSGFEITVLIEECYTTAHDRLDVDLRHVHQGGVRSALLQSLGTASRGGRRMAH